MEYKTGHPRDPRKCRKAVKQIDSSLGEKESRRESWRRPLKHMYLAQKKISHKPARMVLKGGGLSGLYEIGLRQEP